MEGDGLTNGQTEKVLQFQDLTGIEDINICRDVLIRHQWDLEVAIQEVTIFQLINFVVQFYIFIFSN